MPWIIVWIGSRNQSSLSNPSRYLSVALRRPALSCSASPVGDSRSIKLTSSNQSSCKMRRAKSGASLRIPACTYDRNERQAQAQITATRHCTHAAKQTQPNPDRQMRCRTSPLRNCSASSTDAAGPLVPDGTAGEHRSVDV